MIVSTEKTQSRPLLFDTFKTAHRKEERWCHLEIITGPLVVSVRMLLLSGRVVAHCIEGMYIGLWRRLMLDEAEKVPRGGYHQLSSS